MTHRTNILLDDEQVKKLDRLARHRGISRSSIIRDAVDKELQQVEKKEDWKEAILSIQGMWDEAISLDEIRANDAARQKNMWIK